MKAEAREARFVCFLMRARVRAQSLQTCVTLGAPVDCSLPGSSVHGDSPGKNRSVLPFSSPLFPHDNMYLKHVDFSSSHMMSCTSVCIPLGETQCQAVPLSAVGLKCDRQSLLVVEVHFSLLINKQSVADTLHD